MRADKLLAARFGSRTKAQAAIKNGYVLKNGAPISADDELENEDGLIFLNEEDCLSFVSNGARKLEKAFSDFQIDVSGEIAVDLGASTGGFTDCLLRHGAKKVYAVDVGESLLDPRLSQNSAVVVMDKTNARYLTSSDFPDEIGLVTGDLSFISLRLVLPAVRDVLTDGGRAFLLFKPQFECEGKGLSHGILPSDRHKPLLQSFYDFCIEWGFSVQNGTFAPVIKGKNVEYIVHLEKNPNKLPLDRAEFLRRCSLTPKKQNERNHYENRNKVQRK